MKIQREQEESCTITCFHSPPVSDDWVGYTAYLGELLGSQPDYRPAAAAFSPDWPEPETTGTDLVILDDVTPAWWQRLLRWTPACKVVNQSSGSILLARQPRWPFRRILLILRAHETDEAAIKWLGKLAIPAKAEVFVLPIVPPMPGMYNQGTLPLQEEVLLAPNTFSGAQLRRLTSLCVSWDLTATLLIDNREPQRRIEWAANTSDCDLIILNEEPYLWMNRWLLGEIVRPLLYKCNRPVLVTKYDPH